MRSIQPWIAAIAIVAGVSTVMAVDVKIDFDKTFAFKDAHTWEWNPKGSGQIVMARTPDDDPEAFRKLAEPIILSEVATEMGRSKLQQKSEAPDLVLTYYVLLSTSMSAQTMGQFLPATYWGLPPFAPSTSSLRVMNQGSLVLDFSAAGNVVWRGVAQAEIKPDADNKKRESVLRDAVRSLLRRFPPK